MKEDNQCDQVTAHQRIDPAWCPDGKDLQRERQRDVNESYIELWV